MVRASDLQAHDTQSQDQLDRLMQRMETLQHLAEQVNAAIDATPSERPSTSGSRPPTASTRPPTASRPPTAPALAPLDAAPAAVADAAVAAAVASLDRAKADDDDAASSLGGRRRRVDARAAKSSVSLAWGGGAKENGSSPANRAPSALEAVEAEELRLSQSFRGLDQQIRRLNRDSRG